MNKYMYKYKNVLGEVNDLYLNSLSPLERLDVEQNRYTIKNIRSILQVLNYEELQFLFLMLSRMNNGFGVDGLPLLIELVVTETQARNSKLEAEGQACD